MTPLQHTRAGVAYNAFHASLDIRELEVNPYEKLDLDAQKAWFTTYLSCMQDAFDEAARNVDKERETLLDVPHETQP